MNGAVLNFCLWGFAIFIIVAGGAIVREDDGRGLVLIACGMVLMFHLGTS
jgi:hypothetical protein